MILLQKDVSVSKKSLIGKKIYLYLYKAIQKQDMKPWYNLHTIKQAEERSLPFGDVCQLVRGM